MPSGYFSTPNDHLDPDLFDGENMKPVVREGLLNMLYNDLRDDLGFKNPENWVVAWLAGSGASYQWDADRGNGDLDVLFGVDFPQFLDDNPQFPRLSEPEVAAYTDKMLKAKSWPKTQGVKIGNSSKRYEITFFWNPGMSQDIRNIHAYAAYDLIMDRWDVKPPELPEDPRSQYPEDWFNFTNADQYQAGVIQDMAAHGGQLGRHQAKQAAKSMWDTIHGGRRQAFSDVGLGYWDFHNFRWQRAKESGIVETLRGIIGDDEPEAEDTPQDIITRAALRYATPRYWQ